MLINQFKRSHILNKTGLFARRTRSVAVSKYPYNFSIYEREGFVEHAIQTNDAQSLKIFSHMIRYDPEIVFPSNAERALLDYWIKRPAGHSFNQQLEHMIITGADQVLRYFYTLGLNLSLPALLRLLGNNMVHEGHIGVLKVLIEAGTDVNAADTIDGTPVLIRMIRQCKDEALLEKAVGLLLMNHADPRMNENNFPYDNAIDTTRRYLRPSIRSCIEDFLAYQNEISSGYVV